MQYCFFIASDFTFTTRQIHIWALFPLWPATSSFLELIVLCSSLVACWTLSDMDGELLTFLCHIYLPFHTAHEALGKNTRVHCHFLLQWTIFCQNSSLWPIHLGCPCTIWFVASLSYASLFAKTCEARTEWDRCFKSRAVVCRLPFNVVQKQHSCGKTV